MVRNGHPHTPDEAVDDARLKKGRTAESSEALDDRFSDFEVEQDTPFLRAQKRVPVRRGALPSKKIAHRVKIAVIVVLIVGVLAGIGAGLAYYVQTSTRFRLASSDHLDVRGNVHIAKSDIVRVFGGDITKSVFVIPLEQRKQELEQLPWVESATVMRLLPNRIQVDIKERIPVAFAQVGSRIELIDANGVLMEIPTGSQSKYSFPVIVGMGEAEPVSTRAARMKIYTELVTELDTDGAANSKTLSEVDVRDPEDVKVRVDDAGGAVLVHLGDSNFGQRYRIFLSRLQQWRQENPNMESVDLRYTNQIYVNSDSKPAPAASPETKPKPPAAKPVVAKPAVIKPVAGKPAAAIRRTWKKPAAKARKPQSRTH